MSNITESDLDMIAYFYFDRGDSELAMLTRLLKSDIEEMGMELRRLEREMEGES